jgi:phosphonate transport system substrate-binding protein
MKFLRFFPILAVVVLLLSACQAASTPVNEVPVPTQAANLTQEQILAIGIVSDDPAGEIEAAQPFADYMAKQLGDIGIKQGTIVVTPDIETMIEKLKSGEVDLYYESAYGALSAYEDAGAIPLLRGWRKGVGEYHSIFLVRKDSGITSVEDLKGKMIAFSEQKSTTGHFLPETYLITNALTLSEQAAPNSAVPGDEVGYIFAGSPENMLASLMDGKVAAGAEEGAVYDDLTQEQKDQLVVLANTQDIPRSFLMASAKMNDSLRERIVAVLKEAANTEKGTAALKSIKKTAKFDDFPSGSQATMEFLQGLFAPVKE